MESFTQQPLAPNPSAYLIALDTGFSYREYRIAAPGVTIGRDAGRCDIVVAGTAVSRRHLRIAVDGGGRFRLEDLDSTNGAFVNGAKVAGSIGLEDGDLIGLGSGNSNHLRFQSRSSRENRKRTLAAQAQWRIGRAPDCDLALPFEPMVSAYHAVLTPHANTLRITDHHSLNGTWINGRAMREGCLTAADTVVIGSTHFRFQLETDGTLSVQQREYGQAVHLECIGLTRTITNGRSGSKVLLDDVTLSFAPGEFVGILGPSGAGKTTLLTALNGFTRPNGGEVLFNGTPLGTAYEMFRNTIGYVPQDDILHSELSVETSLDYIARLRLSPDIDAAQRANIVDATIETLGLQQVRRCPIHQLSGGQRKRVSIGAELLVRPSILFLDEPTSGLDPSVEERLMRHFRNMAHNGTTVVITTHVLYNLTLLDKVVILAQGKLVFFGPPGEALEFFSKEGTPLTRPTGIFDLLTGEEEPSSPDNVRISGGQEEIAARFAQQYRHSPAYAEYIERRLSPVARQLLAREDECPDRTLAAPPSTSLAARSSLPAVFRLTAGRRGTSSLWPWLILSQRHLHIRCTSAKRLLWFLFIPLALALVTLSQHMNGVLADEVARKQKESIREAVVRGGAAMESQLKGLLSPAGVYDPRSGADLLYGLHHEGLANLPVPMSVLLMIVMTAVFSGTLIACLEISTEQSIYRRERMSHLRLLPYLGSKLPFCLMITALQCFVFLSICRFNPAMRQTAFFPIWLTMIAIAWSSVATGLFLSTVDPTAGRFSVLLAIAVVLPQLILSGGLGPDFYSHMPGLLRWVTDLLPARRGLEMVCTALFNSFTGESTRWIPDFVRQVIGFDFGGSVYYSGCGILMAQSLLWFLFSAWFLKRRDIR